MKVDALFVIMCIVFIFAAWVATGGPSRPIATAGPFITPITRSGEVSQGYRTIVPVNPLNTGSYPRQIGGKPATIASGPDRSQRDTTSSTGGREIYIDRMTLGPAQSNPNQEYVTLVNRGTTEVDIRDWRIESSATGESVGVLQRLGAGDTLHVVSGRESAHSTFFTQRCDEPGTTCIFLNRNLELWAKPRETITLYDETGKVLDSFSY